MDAIRTFFLTYSGYFLKNFLHPLAIKRHMGGNTYLYPMCVQVHPFLSFHPHSSCRQRCITVFRTSRILMVFYFIIMSCGFDIGCLCCFTYLTGISADTFFGAGRFCCYLSTSQLCPVAAIGSVLVAPQAVQV